MRSEKEIRERIEQSKFAHRKGMYTGECAVAQQIELDWVLEGLPPVRPIGLFGARQRDRKGWRKDENRLRAI
jgi:hypothetical protein